MYIFLYFKNFSFIAIFKKKQKKKKEGVSFGVNSFECIFLLINLRSVLQINPFPLSHEVRCENVKLLTKFCEKLMCTVI